MLHRFSVKMSRQTTLGRFGFKKSISHRNSMMETKVPDFVSTMSRRIKCNHCSKLFVNQQGLSLHSLCTDVPPPSAKIGRSLFSRFFLRKGGRLYTGYLYMINCVHGVSGKLIQNLSLGFILKIFLKFRKFQPQYSYTIYSYKKKKECK